MNLYGIRIWENKLLFAWVQKFVACYLWVHVVMTFSKEHILLIKFNTELAENLFTWKKFSMYSNIKFSVVHTI